MNIFLLLLLIVPVFSINKISWTLSKPPANLFRWETSKESPTYTLASLSEGDYVLQAIATNEDGVSTHSGVLTGTISTVASTENIILNPLIQADAARYQQPSYIKWIKTNSTTVYPNDVIELTIKGVSNPPNTDMQFTINGQTKCTSSDTCVIEHTIPENALDSYILEIAVVGMGYNIPMQFVVKDYVPVEFRAVFNVPPIITAINSGISLLHQIGTSTTISATFEDQEGSNIKYTWTTEAIMGSCPITELEGSLTDTVASGSTVTVIFTPTTLGNKCIVKIRCEDMNGGISLGEVYIYVDNVPIHFPPYVISKLQSKQTAAIGEKIDMSIEMCEPQEQMVTVQWQTTCGTLDHAADTITDSTSCTWLYNDVTLTSVPCSVSWIATDSDSSISTGTFRILSSDGRRLKTLQTPIVFVRTTEESMTTEMVWEIADDTKEYVDKKEVESVLGGSDIALIVLISVMIVCLIIIIVLMKMRKVECVIPDKIPDVEMATVKKITTNRVKTLRGGLRARSPRTIKKPVVQKEDEEKVNITPKMIARGSRRQMRIKRKEKLKRHSDVMEAKKKMLPVDMHLEHDKEKGHDENWSEHISHHRQINTHPNRGIKRVKK